MIEPKTDARGIEQHTDIMKPVDPDIMMQSSGSGYNSTEESQDSEEDTLYSSTAANRQPMADRDTKESIHYWRQRPPLLPQSLASAVSKMSSTTRLSLEITSLFWESVFEAISDSTSGGVRLGSVALEELKSLALGCVNILSPLSSLNPSFMSRIMGTSTHVGYTVVNRSVSAVENLLEGSFQLYTKAVNVGLHAAGEYVRFIDAVFGSTDTSRVLASFVHMCKRETVENNPEIRALINEYGIFSFASQVLKTLVAWTCLQVVTHGRPRAYRMELVYSNYVAQPFCARINDSNEGATPGIRASHTTPASAFQTPVKSSCRNASLSAGHSASSDIELQLSVDSLASGGLIQSDWEVNAASSHMPLEMHNHIQVHLSDADSQPNSRRAVPSSVGGVFSTDESDDHYYVMSDQEGAPHRDPEWDKRLMEALRGLSIQINKEAHDEEVISNEAGARQHTGSFWQPYTQARRASVQWMCADTSDEGTPVHAATLEFESAPASLVSSPQQYVDTSNPVHRFKSTPDAEFTVEHEAVAGTSNVDKQNASSRKEVPGFNPLDAEKTQEFPHRPLLFNIARFVTLASSAYGHQFMGLLGVKDEDIDTPALIATHGNSDDSIFGSPGTPRCPGSRKSPNTYRSPGISRSIRAQHMSTYDRNQQRHNRGLSRTHSRTELRHFRSPRADPPSRNVHRRRRTHRPISDHPNHASFARHTGIPISDLLFSSYVSPIVPGVTRAASARASAVERRLRNRRSMGKKASAQSLASDPVSGPKPAASGGGWISAIPVLESLYKRMPSTPTVSSMMPTAMARMLGKGSVSQPAIHPVSEPQPSKPADTRVHRLDRIRQRLVYRNPSIHALIHYISVDHATSSVVLSCRGTLGLSDLFIDMICEYESVQLPAHVHDGEFRVHSGMWHSALMLADSSSEVFCEAAEALRMYPNYGLVLTGHSLGGGVATLLTLLWSQPARDSPYRFVTSDLFGLVAPRPIHCFSYGSPCSTNAALSEYCRGLVTSIVNSNDFVTYLSIGSCVDILNISAVLGRERGVAEKVVRRFLETQKSRITRKFRLFDFDFSDLSVYSDSEFDDDDDVVVDDEGEDEPSVQSEKRAGGMLSSLYTAVWGRSSVDKWSTKTTQSRKRKTLSGSSSGSSSPHPEGSHENAERRHIDDWYWSLVKTLRANMDSEKLYPPGDVYVLGLPGEEEATSKMFPVASELPNTSRAKAKSQENISGVGLFYCPDVTERFSELRFTKNMISHHLPSTYEKRIASLVHGSIPIPCKTRPNPKKKAK